MTGKIYLIECNNDGIITYKIGRTSRRVTERIKELDVASSGKLRVIFEYVSHNVSILEGTLHRQFNPCHIKGEWFSCDLNIEDFKSQCKIMDTAIEISKNTI